MSKQQAKVGSRSFKYDDLNELYNVQGKSMSEIASQLGVKQRTIEIALKKLGIKKVWTTRAITNETIYQDRDELLRLLASGLNASQIGERFGVHARTITYWMKKCGISYKKSTGYKAMRRNTMKRAEMKALRKEEKERKRVAAMKYPGRGKGKAPMSAAARLKSSIANVCNNNKSPSKGEDVFAKCVQATSYAFQPEQPIVFFDARDRIIAACRADYYLPKGTIHPGYAVMVMFDGVWHHQQSKVRARDRVINNIANHCGIIVIRLWSDEAPNEADGKRALNDLLSRVPKLGRPVLIRHKSQIVNERTVTIEAGITCVSTCLSRGTGKHETYSAAALQGLREKIDRGEWVGVNDALRAFQGSC